MVPGLTRSRWMTALAVTASLALAASDDARAQARTEHATNPLAGQATAVRQGQNIYRGRCAVCHGIDAKGYRGSDLTSGDWVHGGSDRQIFTTITTGVAGTEMPGNTSLSEDEVWMLVAYLRTLSAPGGPVAERGDAARGEELFWAAGGANCGRCHMIGAARRPPRPEPVAHRRLAIGVGARARDPAAGRSHPDRLRDHHRDDP